MFRAASHSSGGDSIGMPASRSTAPAVSSPGSAAVSTRQPCRPDPRIDRRPRRRGPAAARMTATEAPIPAEQLRIVRPDRLPRDAATVRCGDPPATTAGRTVIGTLLLLCSESSTFFTGVVRGWSARAAVKRETSVATAARSSCPPSTRKAYGTLGNHSCAYIAGLLVLPTSTHPSPDGSSRPMGGRIHGATSASGAWNATRVGNSHPVPRFSSSVATGSRSSGGWNLCAVCWTAWIRSTR